MSGECDNCGDHTLDCACDGEELQGCQVPIFGLVMASALSFILWYGILKIALYIFTR